jgi:hypothetical protein
MKCLFMLSLTLLGLACGRSPSTTADGGTTHCGGLGGATCPDGQVCGDDPGDACRFGVDPDCSGLCFPK